jgi:hypothetical protein
VAFVGGHTAVCRTLERFISSVYTICFRRIGGNSPDNTFAPYSGAHCGVSWSTDQTQTSPCPTSTLTSATTRSLSWCACTTTVQVRRTLPRIQGALLQRSTEPWQHIATQDAFPEESYQLVGLANSALWMFRHVMLHVCGTNGKPDYTSFLRIMLNGVQIRSYAS